MIIPLWIGPDGVGRSALTFSTTQSERFLFATLPVDTVEVEVSLQGGGFTSAPDLISFEGTICTFPNPSYYPNGYPFDSGRSIIALRARLSNGNYTDTAVATVFHVQPSTNPLPAPTNVAVDRHASSVTITVNSPNSPNLVGINYYASKFAGGGATGYTKINLLTITEFDTVEEAVDFATLTVDTAASATDPLFFRVQGNQETSVGTTISTAFSEATEVPESVSTIRTQVTLQGVLQTRKYSFDHNRQGNPNSTPPTVSVGAFASMPVNDPLYYVATAVYYNTLTQTEEESPASVEVLGLPVNLTTNVARFPIQTRDAIVRNLSESVFRSHPDVNLHAGTVLRDTVIDPFATEIERTRFILDFLYRVSSFSTLLAIDTDNGVTTTAVSSSVYKQALKQAFSLQSDLAVQGLLDRAFEKLASNFGVTRRNGTPAQGEVTFFTRTRPAQSISIPLGTLVSAGALQFRTLQDSEIAFERLASFFDPIKRIYYVRVPIVCDTVGTVGNVVAGQARSVPAINGLSVTNDQAMFGGTNVETNSQLASRALSALTSIDSGTERGYLQIAADTAGVEQVTVVGPNSEYMLRDVVSGVHSGGKVDVYVKGTQEGNVTDTFAFSFDTARDVQFVVIGDPANYELRALDDRLSPSNPIVSMIDQQSFGLGLRDAITGDFFDLTGVEVTAYDTIRLQNASPVVQPPLNLNDIILGDFRFQQSSIYTFTRQPVDAIVSIQGPLTGTLDSTTYSLFKLASPMTTGISTSAGDYLQVIDTTGINTDPIPVIDEEHVLVAESNEYMNSLGVNRFSIVVKSFDGAITYKGPNDPSGFPDYVIVDGTATVPLAIRRTELSAIADGETVLVSYEHDENFVVTYSINQIARTLQDAVDSAKPLNSDALVKLAPSASVDIAATILLERGSQASTIDSNVRSAIASLFASLRLGSAVRQSDIVAAVESVTGVSHVLLPLTTLCYSAGSLILHELVESEGLGSVLNVRLWNTASNLVWLLKNEFVAATSTAGGSSNNFRGVYSDDVLLSLQDASPELLGTTANAVYIIGSDGLSIPEYSDDATLEAQGYLAPEEKTQARKDLTANRLLVSLPVGDSPVLHSYRVTYYAAQDTRTVNLEPSELQYLVQGTITLTYDEVRR